MVPYALKWIVVVMMVGSFSHKVEGCYPNVLKRKKREAHIGVPDAIAEISDFFTHCLDEVASTIFPSVRSAVDYSIRDAKWFHQNWDDVCLAENGRNNSECWISTLTFLLDKRSELFLPTAQCICDYVGDCPDRTESYSGEHSGMELGKRSVLDEYGIFEDTRKCELTEQEMVFSECIDASVDNFTAEYPTLQYLDGQSISILLKGHFTFCRSSVVENFYCPEWRTTFNVLQQRDICPTYGPEAEWRENLLEMYEDATTHESPVGHAFATCKEWMEHEYYEYKKEIMDIPCEDRFKACYEEKHCIFPGLRRYFCRKTCGECTEV